MFDIGRQQRRQVRSSTLENVCQSGNIDSTVISPLLVRSTTADNISSRWSCHHLCSVFINSSCVLQLELNRTESRKCEPHRWVM